MILIDATPLQSEHRLRGVGIYLRQLLLAIERLGAKKPRYLVSTVGLEHVEEILPKERLFKLYRPHKPAQVYWLYNEPFLRFALHRLKPKVFLAPDFNGLIRNPYGQTVAVLHDLTMLKLSNEPHANLSLMLSDLRWHVYYRKLRRADHIIAISHSAKRDAIELLNIPEERIHVVYHGIDRARFKLSTGCGRYARHGPYFVNVGERHDNKNQARILEAFAQTAKSHVGVKLYFSGRWHAQDLVWLETTCAGLGLRERVRHLGYVPDDDLPSLYGNALAFVFPSLEEGFGMPVLEAMASGAPVITSNCSSLPEVAGGAALLVSPLSTGELARAMTLLLERPDRREGLRERGFLRALEFSWSKTAEETLSAVEACL